MQEEYISIGNIDIDKYKNLLLKPIMTSEVIITYKQIEHINSKRFGLFEKYQYCLQEILENPDYIIEDPKHEDTRINYKEI